MTTTQLNDPSIDFHLRLQEHAFRVPYELIRRNFKNIQKLEERELKKIEEIKKSLKNSKSAEHTKLIKKQLLTSLKQFEKKLIARKHAEDELISRINARADKLLQLKRFQEANEKQRDEISKDDLLEWYREQTNLLVIDYLLKNNEELTDEENLGLKLIKSLGVEKLIDYDLLLVSNKISNSILRGNLTDLINWITENKSHLTKIRSNLEFETRFQEYIELLKKDKTRAALSIFNNHLSQFSRTNFEEIKLASSLLLINPVSLHKKSYKRNKPLFKRPQSNAVFQKYLDLFSNDRYTYLSKLFLQIFYKMNGLPEHDPLLIYLSLGITSLKTKSCYCSASTKIPSFDELLTAKLNKQDIPSPQVVSKCPVCSMEFNQIANDLPYAHNTRSSLFENPVMLPNGNIFDKGKLILFTKINHGDEWEKQRIVDPVEGQSYGLDEMTTVFPS